MIAMGNRQALQRRDMAEWADAQGTVAGLLAGDHCLVQHLGVSSNLTIADGCPTGNR